jgi:hypothetical protein
MPKPWYRPDFVDQRANNQAPEYKLTAEQHNQIEELSIFHCSTEEMAHALGVCRSTFLNLAKRDPEINKRIALGQSKGKRAIRSVQMRIALSGNVTMLMFLGKVILNQLPDSQVTIGGPQDPSDLSLEARTQLAELAKHISQVAIAANTTEVEAEVIERDGTVSRKVLPMNGSSVSTS